MPFPLLAHQAPVLPLKARWPKAFNGTALVVGSIAPDLQNFWNTRGDADFGHTIAGQFVFCLPLTLGVVFLVGHLRLGEVIAARLGKSFAWLADAATDVASEEAGFPRALVSALCGSFSHLAFDAVSHDSPKRVSRAIYHVAHLTFSIHSVTQAVASLLGAIVSVWVLRRMLLRHTREPPPRRGGSFVLFAFALAGAAFGFVRAMPAIRHPDWFFEAARVYVWGYALFLVVAGAAAALVVGAVPLAIFDRVRQESVRIASATVASPSRIDTRGA